jgi:putative membrane protein
MKRVLVFTALVGVRLWCGGLRTWAAPKDRQNPDSKKSDDLRFLRKAASAGMAEVVLGRLAAKHGHSERVRKFGQRMVEDHSMANKQLMEIARRKGMTFSAKMDDTHHKLMDRLREKRRAPFDRDFARHMVRDHKEAVALFKKEARHGKDADLRAFASRTLPTLEHHLKMARRLERHTEGSTSRR